MNQQPFFNAPEDTRNNHWCVSQTCPLNPPTRGRAAATPPSPGNLSSFGLWGPGPGLWGSVAKGAVALLRLGGVRQGHGFQFVLVDSSLPLLFSTAFLPDCRPRRPVASGGLMPRPKLQPCCCVPLRSGDGPALIGWGWKQRMPHMRQEGMKLLRSRCGAFWGQEGRTSLGLEEVTRVAWESQWLWF